MRPPKELSKYVVYSKIELTGGIREEFKYFQTMKEAKAYAKAAQGKRRLFKINYEDKGKV